MNNATELLAATRAPCTCPARHAGPRDCMRAQGLKFDCRCGCHKKAVRSVLAIEAEANSRPRCVMVDGETEEQCVREPSHRGGCVGATGRTLGRLRRKAC